MDAKKMNFIFDMDGVIVDSEPLSDQHLLHFLAEIGKEPQSLQASYRGLNIHAFINQLIKELKLEHDAQVLAKQYRASYLKYLNSLSKLPEIPGAVELIKYLHQEGAKLSLASSAGPKRIELFLSRLRLKKYFPVIICGDDVVHSKPAPDIFLLAAKKMSVNPRECIVIEDSRNGVLAAKDAGMKCIAYGGSAHNKEDLSDADTIIRDFTVLIEQLKSKALFSNLG
jgi:HAD superfamily hydrolase (TIGR01509 family)